ncbi:MAG: glycosyltransferase [Ignavibacteriales bacterium]|nr:glycosyltransferase [Ignavibacteriales bacterium]
MISLISVALLLVGFGYYFYFLLTVNKGLRALKNPSSSAYRPFVSVIIAARNEDQTIVQCLNSILDQDYPENLYEVIVVDDHSTDHTIDAAQLFSAKGAQPSVKILSLNDPDGAGKPKAIAHGIKNAQGEIILCTDADCVVSSKWISSMIQSFESGVAFVAGPVAEMQGKTLFSKIQRLDFLGLITTGAGLIGAGTPIICNGANIAYRKSAFIKVNGYGETSSSCDDETLMQRISIRKIGKIVFNPSSDAKVATNSNSSMFEFWNQRVRWAAKRGHYEDKSILLKLILLYLFFVGFLAVALVSSFQPELRFPVAAIFFAKVVIDLQTLTAGARLLKESVPPFHFVIAELLHVPYIVFTAGVGQIVSLQWKDRILSR